MTTGLVTRLVVLFLITAPATYSISGRASSATEAVYSLIRRDTASPASNSIRLLKVNPADHRFEIPGVAPGIYDLYVLSSDAEGRQTSGDTRLQIKDRDVRNASIDLKPHVNIQGRFNVKREVFTERSPRISLKPKDLPAPYWMQSMAVADEEGAFTLVDVSQGTYTIAVSGLSGGYRVTEIHFNGKALQPLDLVTIGGDENQMIEIGIDRSPLTPSK